MCCRELSGSAVAGTLVVGIVCYFRFDRSKDGKEDLGPHAFTKRKLSYSFHARVHGDLSGLHPATVVASPCECDSA